MAAVHPYSTANPPAKVNNTPFFMSLVGIGNRRRLHARVDHFRVANHTSGADDGEIILDAEILTTRLAPKGNGTSLRLGG